jgi:hypothetical protein
MPDKRQCSKEVQTETKGLDLDNLNKLIVQFIKDYLSFENDFKI